FPRMFGRMMDERLAVVHFWIPLFGAYAISFPMPLLGIAGHPRRYSELSGVQYLAAMVPLQKFITVAAIVTISGQVIFLFNFFRSLRQGVVASANPWQATTLEWTLPSPVPARGFNGHVPAVKHGPYEYGMEPAPGAEEGSGARVDFVMQDA